MTTISRSALVMYSAEQMFDVVNDVRSYPELMEINVVEGPFSELRGTWRFQPLADDACKVSLDLEFEVTNRIAGAALSVLFKQVANTMVDAFVRRGKQVYG